jgi:YesN/AraC family two-component response regulator
MHNHICSYNISNFHLSHTFTESPEDIATHIHDCYELYYFVSGDLTYYIEGQAYRLNKNDIIITNTRELHRIVFNSMEAYERKFIQFKPEYVSAFQTDEYNMLNYFEKRKLGYFNKIDCKDVVSHGIDTYWSLIEDYAKVNSPESQVMIKTLFIQMLVEINKILSKNKDILMGSYEYDEKVAAILEYINENLGEKITLDSLEQMFFVNKYYLCHIFKMNTGFTVIEYIIYKRIMQSQSLLLSGMPALEVSNAVGFGDYSNFYKAFKRIIGTSPKKYAKQ